MKEKKMKNTTAMLLALGLMVAPLTAFAAAAGQVGETAEDGQTTEGNETQSNSETSDGGWVNLQDLLKRMTAK